ncbi:hypothetical protein L209DRAFT_272716 [Thermothelomyces heterothallicus CBS 203.75]
MRVRVVSDWAPGPRLGDPVPLPPHIACLPTGPHQSYPSDSAQHRSCPAIDSRFRLAKVPLDPR